MVTHSGSLTTTEPQEWRELYLDKQLTFYTSSRETNATYLVEFI